MLYNLINGIYNNICNLNYEIKKGGTEMLELIKELTWNKKMEVLRTIKGWSQTEAAEKCYTTQRVYWAWESGNVYPRKSSRVIISQAFGVDESDIF